MAVTAKGGTIRVICLEDTKKGSKIRYEKRDGIRKISIPEEYTKAEIYVGDSYEGIRHTAERQPVTADTDFLKKVSGGEKSRENGTDVDGTAYTAEEGRLLQKLGNLNGLEFTFDVEEPVLSYEDVTDQIMFHFPPIGQAVLSDSSGGLWAYYGIRRFRIKVDKLLDDVNDSSLEVLPKLYFYMKDTKRIPNLEMPEFRVAAKDRTAQKGEKRYYECYNYIDTNRLGEMLEEKEQAALFSGYFEVTFRWTTEETQKRYADISYCLPIKLYVQNTKYRGNGKFCLPLQNKTVSVDFGTSSSCVAVEGKNGIELLTLSSDELPNAGQNMNIYENPTYMMIYRWKEIYDQWRRENGNYPFLARGSREDEFSDGGVQFDFGYSVKNCMDKVNEDELNAILTEIKMLPYILHHGRQLDFRPFVKENKPVVKLVSSPEEEDEEHLDPVAFYAYIIGRAVNNVARNKIYTKFHITYPVKFDKKLREKMRRSFEYGLRRSLPIPLRGEDILRVEMKWAEPVAYIGAICTRYLKLTEGRPELFAVFDFGGGTLDYSFGIFALNPEDDEEAVIHILQVDGDSNIGGETLIKRISYWIYKDDPNKAAMTEGQIPFELPAGENIPDGMSEKLFNNSKEAQSNVRKLNERISRRIFEGESITGEEEIELMSLGGTTVSINCNYDSERQNGLLESILEKKVAEFHHVMDVTFEKYSELLADYGLEKYSPGCVNIYMAGNSSKNMKLKEQMQKKFKENYANKKVWLVDETNKEFTADFYGDSSPKAGNVKESKVAITPKTAVAIGQIGLQKYKVKEAYAETPFLWYVGITNIMDGSFTIKIPRSSPDTGWVKYCKINTEDVRIYYSETRERDGNSSAIHSAELELGQGDIGKFLYLRIADSNHVEYTVCEKGSVPDDGMERNAERVIGLLEV